MAQTNIFTGSPGAGKTTASEFPPISTDVIATDVLSKMKEHTTVAMDFWKITLESVQKICLYGTPGQKRFDFMWEILVQGGLGLIILINKTAPNPLMKLELYSANFADFIAATDVVIGITCMDLEHKLTTRCFIQWFIKY